MPLLPLTVTALGVFLLYKLRFFIVISPLKTAGMSLRAALSGGARSLLLALAGTLGVGNVFGVAISISLGGAGSVFWLLVSSLFASVIKYAEALVSVDAVREGEQGGMMLVAERRLRHGAVYGRVYALVCLFLSLVMGAAMQSSAAVISTVEVLGVPRLAVAIPFVLAALFLILASRERVKSLTAVLVPLAAVIYIAITVTVIIRYAEELPRVIDEILESAFSTRSLGGGVVGFFVSSPVSRGYSTGILSNEAGAGTSSMAHASGDVKSPVAAGLCAMLEVFADTVVICMLTAFAILLPPRRATGGAELVIDALSFAFPHSDLLFAASVTAFALATVICWYFYGQVSRAYLTGRGERVFLVLYLFAVLLGAIVDTGVLAALSDIALLILSLVTAPVIIKSSDRIVALSERYGLIRSKKSDARDRGDGE